MTQPPASENKVPRIQRTVPFQKSAAVAVPERPASQAKPSEQLPPSKAASPKASVAKAEETTSNPKKKVEVAAPQLKIKTSDKTSKKSVPEKKAAMTTPSKDNVANNNPQESKVVKATLPTAATKPHKIPRPESWEDDIAANTLDDRPFVVNPSPSTVGFDVSPLTKQLEKFTPLMGGKDIAEYLANDTYPIPVVEDREGYCPGNDPGYWLNGLGDFLKVLASANRYGVEPKSVFDFGCASGRVLRHFAAQTDIGEIWGSDINQRHVRWLYEHLPRTVKPVFNHCIPTLPLRDGSVDIITAFSVFTHIDTFETHWLAELSRIMSDDGMCYLTVHNEDTWGRLRLEMDNENNRLIKSIVKIDPNFETEVHQPMPAGRKVYRFTQAGPYRAQVFHSNCYLRNVWGRFFDVEAIMPCHHVRQSVVVLRKKSS